MKLEKTRGNGEAVGEILEISIKVKRNTSEFMVRKKLDKDKLKERAEIRAWKYKNMLGEDGREKLARACLEKTNNRVRRGEAVGRWKKEKKQCMEKRSWRSENIEGLNKKVHVNGEMLLKTEKNCKEWKREGKLWSPDTINGTK